MPDPRLLHEFLSAVSSLSPSCLSPTGLERFVYHSDQLEHSELELVAGVAEILFGKQSDQAHRRIACDLGLLEVMRVLANSFCRHPDGVGNLWIVLRLFSNDELVREAHDLIGFLPALKRFMETIVPTCSNIHFNPSLFSGLELLMEVAMCAPQLCVTMSFHDILAKMDIPSSSYVFDYGNIISLCMAIQQIMAQVPRGSNDSRYLTIRHIMHRAILGNGEECFLAMLSLLHLARNSFVDEIDVESQTKWKELLFSKMEHETDISLLRVTVMFLAAIGCSPNATDDRANSVGVAEQCPICFETSADLFTTDCGHKFCKACIHSHIRSKVIGNGADCGHCANASPAECPLCRGGISFSHIADVLLS